VATRLGCALLCGWVLWLGVGCQATPTPFAPVPIVTAPSITTDFKPSYRIGVAPQLAPHLPYTAVVTEDRASVDLWIGQNLDDTLLPLAYGLPLGLAVDASFPPFASQPALYTWLRDAVQQPTPTQRDALANLGYPNGIQLYHHIDPSLPAQLTFPLLESAGIFLRPTSADNVALRVVMGQTTEVTLLPLPSLPLGYTIREDAQHALLWNAEGLPYFKESE